MRALEERNAALQEQLRQQQDVIADLSRRLDARAGEDDAAPELETPKGFSIGNVRLGAQAGLAFFHSGSLGRFPNSEFRVDEAKLFLEAPVWKDTYFFAELDLVTREREAVDESFYLGELYVDFENVSRLWNQDDLLSVRVGRFDIPFGEEYLSRDIMDNPLISHSLSDVWGIDEGVEFYGKAGKFDYVAAVQSGGHPTLRDYDGDKALIGRLGYRPAPWLRVSVSGMRTGNLDAANDRLSEVWFGNGFFRALGSTDTTTRFHASLLEADGQIFWRKGHVKAAAGYAETDDNDTVSNNQREAVYYYVEPMQQIVGGLYAAGRFSQIKANDGLPLAGLGPMGRYFFSPTLTEDIWRASIGLGYKFSEHLTLKVEYSREERQIVNRPDSEADNFFGTEIGLRF